MEKGYLGHPQASITAVNQEPARAEGQLIAELKALNRSAYELRARLKTAGDLVCGPKPEAPGNPATERPTPENIMALLQEIGRVLDNCHEELTRTTLLLGL